MIYIIVGSRPTRKRHLVELRSQNTCFTNFANENVGSAARFHSKLNCLYGVRMGCLVKMLILRNTTFCISLHEKSEHAGLKIREKSGNRGFCLKVKISRMS